MMGKKVLKVFMGIFICAVFLEGCSSGNFGNGQGVDHGASAKSENLEKGKEDGQGENADYKVKSIPMSQVEEREATDKLLFLIEKCQSIFSQADKGDASNVILDEAVVHEMVDTVAAEGLSVTCAQHDYNMRNYEVVHRILQKARENEDAETEFYVLDDNGIFRYYCFQFQCGALTVVSAAAVIEETATPVIRRMEKIQPYYWEYTEKGWLIWEKALSRNHEMDMHIFCRILPLDEKCRQVTEKYISPIGYVSNNLFLVDWDEENMGQIAFNDLYDSLYTMEKGDAPAEDSYRQGIPKEEFEGLIRRHFDVSQGQLEEYGTYDSEVGSYPWIAVGPRNRLQRTRPFPEVVECVKNDDGTLSVYVEAIFVEIGKDCAFSHVVTIREEGDGRWVYLGNKIDWEKSYTVPAYKARKEYTRYPF